MFLSIAVVCFHCCIICYCMNILSFIHFAPGKYGLFLVWGHYNNATIYIFFHVSLDTDICTFLGIVASTVNSSLSSGVYHFLVLWPSFQLSTL